MSKVVLAGSNGLPYPTLKAIIENRSEIVFLGDSVVERVSRHDEDRRTLGQMVADNLAPRSVLTLSRSAHNPDIYLPLLQVMAKTGYRPNTIIIPVNLRCFSPQWELSPDWRFEQERAIIRRYLRFRWLPIKPIADVHHSEGAHAILAKTPVEYELSPFRTVGEFKNAIAGEPSNERSRTIFIYHYTHRLAPTNARLTNLRKCAELAQSIAEQVLIYVTPINLFALRRFVGTRAAEIVRDNASTLQALLPADVRNWTSELPEQFFFNEDLATEHLNESGRRKLADLIVQSLR